MFEAIGNQTDKDVLIASSEALVAAGVACSVEKTMEDILKCKSMLDAIAGDRKLWDGASDNLTSVAKKMLDAVVETVEATLTKVSNPCVFCGTAGNDGVPGVLSGNPEVADGWCCELAAKVRADATCPGCGDPLPDCEDCGWPRGDTR